MSAWRVAGAAAALGLAAALGALGRVPYAADPGGEAAVRLAWRARSVLVERCRRLTPEELAALPAHMRQREVCEGRVLPYRLELRLDEHAVLSGVVHAGGAREDRPVYVSRELRVLPGRHRVEVSFVREADGRARDEESEHGDDEAADDADGHDDRPRRHRGRADVPPPRMALDTTVVLGAGDVLLVTYDPDRRALVGVHR